MVKNKNIALLLTLMLCLATNENIHSKSRRQSSRSSQAPALVKSELQSQEIPRLSQYDFGSGSVLPIFTEKGKTYCILSKEAFGKAKGTYDDFGGSRDPGEDHPVISAAREFFEEAIIELILGLNLKEVMKYIDTTSSHTRYVIANARNVGYIVNFDQYKDAFFANFYAARDKATNWHLKEKDRLAIVEWDKLKHTFFVFTGKSIGENKSTGEKWIKIPRIKVQVLNPETKTFETEEVTLRPYFMIKYRPFFMDKPYVQGMNKKIRFYDFVAPKTKDAQTEIEETMPPKSLFTRFWNWVNS
jgi:hypothetical protein